MAISASNGLAGTVREITARGVELTFGKGGPSRNLRAENCACPGDPLPGASGTSIVCRRRWCHDTRFTYGSVRGAARKGGPYRD